MKIGWHADVHWVGSGGNTDKITNPLNYLFSTKNCDITIFGGDNVIIDDHVASAQTYVEGFWNAVDATGYGNQCYAIPGNHEAPLTAWFRYSDYRAICPRELRYSGISIYLLNTIGSLNIGMSKTEGQGGRTGIGEIQGYIPMADMRWFSEKTTDAKTRGDIRLVFCHHHIYFTVQSADPESGRQCLTKKNFYQLPFNCRTMYSFLQAVEPIIILNGHLYQSTDEGYVTWDSDTVYLVYKDHFALSGGGESTFAYLDVNTSTGQVKVYTVETSDYVTENLILDVTPSW